MSTRKVPFYFVLISVLGLMFGLGYVSYPLVNGMGDPFQVPVNESEGVQATEIDDLAEVNQDVYMKAWQLLERDFYGEKPGETERTYGAIRGLVETFNDPYTYFVEPQPRELERDELRGRFGGIGANIELVEEGHILRPLPGEPAEAAGVRDGDLLLLVDGVEITTTMPVDEVIGLVRGPVGEPVSIVVRHPTVDETEPEEETLTIVRAEIQTPSVHWRILEETAPNIQIGYIEQTLFSERSPEEMRTAIEELLASGADSFILDLRGNPGGLLHAAVEIADMWLDGGVILIERHADGAENIMEATPGTLAGDRPLVVIVDEGSASASEILAGALQDRGRAALVGEKTFGKGSVQLIHELPDASSLHITNAQWYTPERNEITGNGLLPDVLIAPEEDPLPTAIVVVREAAVAKADTED